MPRFDSLEAGALTDISYYILLSLIEAKHGYLIMKTIDQMTDHQFTIGPASMYTTIKKLLAAKLISEIGGTGDRNKKTYVTTKKGLELLQKDVERRRKMVEHAEKAFYKKGE
ncbi:DNA-binding transcriptional regulator, PadR family [Seinonella peptonophila]|uniref:DNA-binding transcriptional regulator, PadR family n=1 Tax=Seinonella peptonophila TaxID=112248 RepID=A0A1M4XKP7_9BACL|nr:PadR family transcriptional regulator [Seinonella peptonophila]SHE93938.1 DNA-binding transcriptional regulator, PadR family [Seinonella peptonophila]